MGGGGGAWGTIRLDLINSDGVGVDTSACHVHADVALGGLPFVIALNTASRSQHIVP